MSVASGSVDFRYNRSMRMLLILFALLLLPSLAAADELDYWIDEMVLPATAILVHNEGQDILAGEYADELGNIVPGRRVTGMRVVNFDCPAGWSAVQEHFAGFLAGLGYLDARWERIVTRLMEKKGLERADAEEKALWVIEKVDGIAGETLEYMAADGSLQVMVWDNGLSNAMLLDMAAAMHLPAPDLGDYSVILMTLEAIEEDGVVEQEEIPPMEAAEEEALP
jgi:hypothetical protein